MLSPTLKTFAMLLAALALLALPAAIWPAYLESPIGRLLAAPYFLLLILSGLGFPGLLQNNGLCGWGWCAPSPLGYFVMLAAILAALYGCAALISRMRGS